MKKYALARKGVRQGCSMSPLLFNIFIESTIKTFKTKGVIVSGKQIHCSRFADDIAIVVKNERDLGNMMKSLSMALEQVPYKCQKKKTNTC